MKLQYFVFVLGALSAAFGNSSTGLQTVASVDPNRYAGKWYEIARYPNRFEKKCISDVTAEYTLLQNGKMQVVNSCREKEGNVKVSKGTAKIVDRQSNAKLKVTFFWPFYGDYWIIELDPEYRYAVVSEPGKKYLWILSRTPRLDAAVYDEILARIQEKGFDPSRLIRPDQSAD